MSLVVRFIILGLVVGFSLVNAECKAIPGSPKWLKAREWDAFNSSLGGHLIKPIPQEQSAIQLNPHITPLSVPQSNQPGQPSPSTASTFYVVNVSTAEHVNLAVRFAGRNNIRLIVKGTGHDYMGRSSASNSLSIWTYHLKGMQFHTTSFKPKGCRLTIPNTAMTVAARHTMMEIYTATNSHNLTVVGGQAAGVGVGGYITGGGHSSLSVTQGMAADNVLEVQPVTPSGEIVITNECQNTDLFFAFRGGGGGAFGVLLDVTIRTLPTPAVSKLAMSMMFPAPATEDFWDVLTYIISQFPYLSRNSISGYSLLLSSSQTSPTTTLAAYTASFMDHSSPFNASNISQLFAPIFSHIQTTWPNAMVSFEYITTSYPSFLEFFEVNSDKSPAGNDYILVSRLIDERR